MSPRQQDEPSIKILAEKALCYPRAFAEGLSHVFQSNRHSGDFLIMPLACASNKTWTNSRADFILCLKMVDFSYHKNNHFSPTHDFILLGSKMLSLFRKQTNYWTLCIQCWEEKENSEWLRSYCKADRRTHIYLAAIIYEKTCTHSFLQGALCTC